MFYHSTFAKIQIEINFENIYKLNLPLFIGDIRTNHLHKSYQLSVTVSEG